MTRVFLPRLLLHEAYTYKKVVKTQQLNWIKQLRTLEFVIRGRITFAYLLLNSLNALLHRPFDSRISDTKNI